MELAREGGGGLRIIFRVKCWHHKVTSREFVLGYHWLPLATIYLGVIMVNEVLGIF